MESQENLNSFHSRARQIRKNIHIVLVGPEVGGNVGAVLRASMNMGIEGNCHLIGDRSVLNEECRIRAKHAAHQIESMKNYPDLETYLDHVDRPHLLIGASQRVGSSARPHPVDVREAMELATRKLMYEEIGSFSLVFGPENSGLSNKDIALCDWIVEIPSSKAYRSLNLSHAVAIFAHEVNMNLVTQRTPFESGSVSQKERLVSHLIQLAEEAGFILPRDPYKMRPKLERIFAKLPRHLPEARTLHGLLDQVRRSMKRGAPDFKGKYRKVAQQMTEKAQDAKPRH